jgi:hypothetical protein
MQIDSEELSKRIQDLELVELDKQAATNLEQELRNNISELEGQLVEKNKVNATFIRNVDVFGARNIFLKHILQHFFLATTFTVINYICTPN